MGGTGIDARILQVLPNSFVESFLDIACLLANQIKLGAIAQLVRALLLVNRRLRVQVSSVPNLESFSDSTTKPSLFPVLFQKKTFSRLALYTSFSRLALILTQFQSRRVMETCLSMSWGY